MAGTAEDRLARTVKRLALVFALSVAIGLPGGYFVQQYSHQIEHVKITAQLKAEGLNALVAANPELWIYELQRVEELLRRYPAQLVDDRATVRDAAGNSLLTVGVLPDAPVLVRSSPIYDSGRVVGQVEVTHSYREVVFGTLVAGLLGLLLGGLVYATLLVLPLRALRRVTAALVWEQAALRDVRERLAAEEAQRQQITLIAQSAEKERLLRLFYELPFVGLAVTSPGSKRWLQVNDCLCEMLGYPREELLEITWTEITHPDDLPANLALFQRLAAGEFDAFQLDKRFLRKDGGIVATTMECRCVRREDGSLDTVVTMVQNITERKRSEEALRQSEARFRSLTELSSDLYWEQDDQYRFTLVEGTGSDRVKTGAAQPGVGKKRWERNYINMSADDWAVHIATLDARQPFHDLELCRLDDSGKKVWVGVSGEPVFDQSGVFKGYRGLGKDITERKCAEEQLSALNAELEVKVAARTEELAIALDAATESDRLKSDFMANVTHELRTPLNSVIGCAELLKDGVLGPLNEKQAAFAADILTSGQRLLALVEGILEMSRLDAAGAALEREPVEIGAALEQCVAAQRKAAEARGLTMRLDVAADAGRADLDPMALRRMFDALLDNAIKFNREGGTVVVSARRAEGELDIAVTDTGIGIAREDLAKLFKPLAQLDSGLARRHGGVGLGLALARRLAEQHGGTIEVESETGKGSAFTLRLPMRERV